MKHNEFDFAKGKGKTQDARKRQPKAAGTTKNDATMINYKGKKANTGGLDARKKNAKPTPCGVFQSTLM